jgi:hypothetical protein
MSKKAYLTIAILSVFLAACAELRGRYGIPAEHPEKLSESRPYCSSCHKDATGGVVYRSFDHTISFAQGSHSAQARQNEQMCAMCHDQSSCNDCHVTRSELKPSVRRSTETYRQLPHRGDYRTRHQIDGRLDPMSCFSCHGNPKAAQSCAPCHGK